MSKFLALRLVIFVVLTLLVGYLSGCASIASKSMYNVQLSSEPSGADVKVTDSTGFVVFKGKTPVAVPLKASKGFYSKSIYTVTFQKDGHARHDRVLEANIDGWYFGNLFVPFLGWLSFVIIDPATGAMWKLEERVHGVLEGVETSSLDHGGLHILSLDDVPKEFRQHLVKIE